jgi:hypothetical protein
MALTGKGAIVIWNDITPEGRADFYDWHHHEHMPERLAIPGFLRGSRYIAQTAETKPEYLTLYELADSGIAMSAPYLARLNAPTEWTRRATSHFRNTQRALTEVVRSEGEGPGGVMATIRFADSEAGEAALGKLEARTDMLIEIARLPRITGAHLCATNTTASAAKTAESRHRNDILSAPIGVILIEGCDGAAVDAAVARLLHDLALPASGLVIGRYALEHIRHGSNAGDARS